MITTLNPQYGHYMVRKMNAVEDLPFGFCSITNNQIYGIFKINHARYSYDIASYTDPRKAYKIDLEPVGLTCFQRRDWYTGDMFNPETCQIFDNYYEALNWANSMNCINEVK